MASASPSVQVPHHLGLFNTPVQGFRRVWKLPGTSTIAPRGTRMARRREKGFVLITIALCALALFGACGLAVDVGRMYVVKNELQVFSDAAALAATLRLNGEAGGVARARTEVEAVRAANKWHLNNNQ